MTIPAITLAMVWYLAVPPPLLDSKGSPATLVDADRPVSEWERVQSFSSAGECRTRLKDWQIEAHEDVEHATKPATNPLLLELNRRQAARCVEGSK